MNIGSATKTMKYFWDTFGIGDGWFEVYQVPSGKRFVLTDVFFNRTDSGTPDNAITLHRNSPDDACGVGMTRVLWINLRGTASTANGLVFLPHQTGYEFSENERICLATSGGGTIFYNLSGYETDM